MADFCATVWRYYYEGAFPNTQTFPEAGAYHSSEIPEVFGTYGIAGNPTANEVSLSKYMQTAWANFAKNPSNGPGWPQLSTGLVADLGGPSNPGGENSILAAVLDAQCVVSDPWTQADGFQYSESR